MIERKKTIGQLLVGTIGAFAGLLCVNALNQYLLMELPIGMRMVLMIGTYWLIVVVPLWLIISAKEKFIDYGFAKEKVGKQILVGIIIGICMSFVLTLLPILAGKGDLVNNGHNYQYLWQILYEFVYCILAIGLVEEFVFRGFVYSEVRKISGSVGTAIVISSILFGLFHFLSGNIIQMIMTGIIGAFFCVCKEKIKGCTLLSLMIAHGLYDALITVWALVF